MSKRSVFLYIVFFFIIILFSLAYYYKYSTIFEGNESFSRERYKLVENCNNMTNNYLPSCGFYFKTRNFDSFFIKQDKITQIDRLLNSDNCFNIDYCNNILYKIIRYRIFSYKYNNTDVTFNIHKNNSDFLDCFKQFINDCSYVTYDINNNSKTITYKLSRKSCILYLNSIVDINFDISKITNDNIEKIRYSGKNIDLTKKYLYGILNYDTEKCYCIGIVSS